MPKPLQLNRSFILLAAGSWFVVVAVLALTWFTAPRVPPAAPGGAAAQQPEPKPEVRSPQDGVATYRSALLSFRAQLEPYLNRPLLSGDAAAVAGFRRTLESLSVPAEGRNLHLKLVAKLNALEQLMAGGGGKLAVVSRLGEAQAELRAAVQAIP